MNKAFRPGERKERRPAGPLGLALEARLPALAELWRAELSGGGPKGTGSALSPAEVESAGAALLRLQRGLTGERGLAGEPYMDDSRLLGAYLLYYWPVSYLEASLALATLAASGRAAPRRVLDLGAGPGPLSAAALDLGAEELCLVDSSARALDLAGRLLGPAPRPGERPGARSEGRRPDAGLGARSEGRGPDSPRPSAPRSAEGRGAKALSAFRLDLEAEGAAAALPPGPFDAVLMGRAVNELWKGREDRLERRLDLLKAAQARLAPGGFLLVLEPAVLLSSREALELRDRLVTKGAPILGPCLRQGPCPALAAGPGHSCHGEYPWSPPEPVASLARRAGLDRSSVKTTWFAAGRPGDAPPGAARAEAFQPAPAAAPSEALPAGAHKAAPSVGAPREAASPREGAGPGGVIRALVVSEPMLNKAGRTRYLLCGEEGRRAFSAAKDDGRAQAAGFRTLGRYDIVRITRPEARPGQGEGKGRGAAAAGRAGSPAARGAAGLGKAEPREEAARNEAAAIGFGPETLLEIERAPRP